MWYRDAQYTGWQSPVTPYTQQQSGQVAQQPNWQGWQPPATPNQQQMEQNTTMASPQQQATGVFQTMNQAMAEGRMPIRSGDGTIGYLERGMWSTQKPAGFGSQQYSVVFNNGSSQISWISPDALQRGAQFSANNFQSAQQMIQDHMGGTNANNALVQIDANTFTYIPANLCQSTTLPTGSNWYQYQTLDGRTVYGAAPEQQVERAQQLAEAKSNTQATQPNSRTHNLPSALGSYDQFNQQYEKMYNTDGQLPAPRSNRSPQMHPRHPGGRQLPG